MVHIAGLMIGLLNPLAQGVTVVILPKFVPEEFLSSIQKYRVHCFVNYVERRQALFFKKQSYIILWRSELQGTFSLLAPPVVNFLANDPMVDRYDLSSLRDPYSGASTLGKELTEKMVERLKLDGIRQGTSLQSSLNTIYVILFF